MFKRGRDGVAQDMRTMRPTTRETDALQTPQLSEGDRILLEEARRDIRRQARFVVPFQTDVIATLDGPEPGAALLLGKTIQKAKEGIENQEQCHLRVHSVFFQPISFPVEEDQESNQYTYLIGTLILETVRVGGTPRTSGKRKYE